MTTTTTRKAGDLTDGTAFSLDGGRTWHVLAVNMAPMGTVSCYVSGRKSTRGMTYRVPVDVDTVTTVLAPAAAVQDALFGAHGQLEEALF